jgi:uncharacterized membrane protein
VKIHSEKLKKIGNSLKFESNEGYAVSILIALLFVAILFVGYFALLRPIQRGYTTVYLLDTQEKAINYPELLVINQNSTFNVYVDVENHMGKTQTCQVLLKVVNGTIPSVPVDARTSNSYVKTLENGEVWKNSVTVSLNEPGNYSAVFELWIHDQNAGAFQFTYNYCVLNLEVVDQV